MRGPGRHLWHVTCMWQRRLGIVWQQVPASVKALPLWAMVWLSQVSPEPGVVEVHGHCNVTKHPRHSSRVWKCNVAHPGMSGIPELSQGTACDSSDSTGAPSPVRGRGGSQGPRWPWLLGAQSLPSRAGTRGPEWSFISHAAVARVGTLPDRIF